MDPSKFLGTKIDKNNGEIKTCVFRKPASLPAHWSSKVPKRYKRNAINGELSRASKISSDLESEKRIITTKYINAGYPPNFIKSVIRQFDEKQQKIPEMEELIIPHYFFPDEELPRVMIEIPYCLKNELVANHFLKKLKMFTQSRYEFLVIWKTRKVLQLFPLKDKNPYSACKIYHGECNQCNVTYIGETHRNVKTRWMEYENPTKNLSHPNI